MKEIKSSVVGWVPKDETEEETLRVGNINQSLLDTRVTHGENLWGTKEECVESEKKEAKKVRIEVVLQVTVTEIAEDNKAEW